MHEADMSEDPEFDLIDHRFLEKDLDDGTKVHAIELLEGPLDGMIFSYDKVEMFVDADDIPRLKWDYDLHRMPPGIDQDEFDDCVEQIQGTFLLGLISKQLKDGSLIYKGGKDADGKGNTEFADVSGDIQS